VITHTTKPIVGLLPVALALMGNIFVAIIKFFGFTISGSGAMFSESVHSVADTVNQSLLLFGIRRSRRRPDEGFSYGYGKERFFWALISACGIFFLGAGVTVYHGIELLITKEMPELSPMVFIILFVSFVVESFTLFIAWRELKRSNVDRTFAEALLHGDPSTIAVLYEDGVAVLGVLVALVSLTLTVLTGNAIWDAVGSILVGLLLGVVAIILIQKNHKYLIGMNIPDEIRMRIIEILEADPTIDRVLDFKSSVLDVGIYHIKCEIEFNGSALMYEVAKRGELRDEYDSIRDDYSEFLKLVVGYFGRVPRLMGSHIDRLEKIVQKEIPEIRHIDIEIN